MTAVEFLVGQMITNGALDFSDIAKAKEMEKRQIIDACKYGNNFEQGDLRCEVYYNKTFKSE